VYQKPSQIFWAPQSSSWTADIDEGNQKTKQGNPELFYSE
jgi:hypothetical protein